MNKYAIGILLLNLLILLGAFNYSIVQKEKILTGGKLVLLELAPVDPRALMQGDYMRLSYAIANQADTSMSYTGPSGYCVVKTNDSGVASFVRLQKDKTTRSNKETSIRFIRTDGISVYIGGESYFFQEGQAEKYDHAKYGGMRVDGNGNSVLVGLYDGKRKLIK